jgi:hypothetical protein
MAATLHFAQGAKAAHLNASIMAFSRAWLKTIMSCQVEDGVDLTVAVELRRFVGKYMDVLQRDNGAAVMQLALH